jgi:hypothetical protein
LQRLRSQLLAHKLRSSCFCAIPSMPSYI